MQTFFILGLSRTGCFVRPKAESSAWDVQRRGGKESSVCANESKGSKPWGQVEHEISGSEVPECSSWDTPDCIGGKAGSKLTLTTYLPNHWVVRQARCSLFLPLFTERTTSAVQLSFSSSSILLVPTCPRGGSGTPTSLHADWVWEKVS